MDINTRADELRAWLREHFPPHRVEIRVRGRQLVIAWISATVPPDPEPLVRLRCQPNGTWQVSYYRHTGRWEAIPPLGGLWPAVRQALADDPMGLFWAGLD
jgi:hypothetical protein